MLVDAGFGVGMSVKRKIDKVEGVIKGMTATQVNVEVGGDLKAVSAESFLKGDWRLVSEKVVPEPLLGWSEVTPEIHFLGAGCFHGPWCFELLACFVAFHSCIVKPVLLFHGWL